MSDGAPDPTPVPPRRRKRDRIRTVVRTVRPSRSFLSDAFAMFLGVFVALAAYDWWQGIRDAEARRTALTALSSELAVNRVVLEETVHYHERTVEALETIQARLEAGEEDANPAAAIPDGLRPASLQSTAWETALASDRLERLEFAPREALARAYTTQAAYQRLTGGVLQAVTAANFTGDLWDVERRPQITVALQGAVRDLLSQEEILMAAYRDAEVALAGLWEEAGEVAVPATEPPAAAND